jgi:hypothetical protein
MPAPHSGRRVQPQPRFGLRLAIFIAVVVLVAAMAAWLLRPQVSQAPADQTIEVTMSGFTPPNVLCPPASPRPSGW